ncbi:uncharacterized protein BDZ99DRAFT_389894 [Mytilinidion resinicola]|uniref:Uncharacterized protein n=1 Tax=Mytilinidion resinicola TaxID=574789 RepID=A0A6A6YLW5_9PEZI|nr:uncharacterized protein BDZ99DRAFT_389894 [Mytilinidion resinicola]KAF2808857.1 hypothetical protein BDZ99DRAFT_389894 [Mytilinidion resinicola]
MASSVSQQRQLDLLRREYLQLVEIEHIRWPDGALLKTADTQAWIYENLIDRDKLQSSPPDRYQVRFLKSLVSKIESAIEDPEEEVRHYLHFLFASSYPEISEDLISHLATLLSSKQPSEAFAAQQRVFVTYAFPNSPGSNEVPDERTVTILESRSVLASSGSTGLRTWESGLHLGKFLSTSGGIGIVRGQNVLELGAGTGLLSILCAKHLGASRVTATDGDESIVDSMRDNVFINGVDASASSTSVECAALKWGFPLDAKTFEEDYGLGKLDVVLAADVTYDKRLHLPLVSTLSELFDIRPSLKVLLAAAVRNEQTFEAFVNACKRNNFGLADNDFDMVPIELQDGPFYSAAPIRILTITRSQERGDRFKF